MLVKRKGLSSNHLLFRSYIRLQGCIQTFPLEALTVEFRSEEKNFVQGEKHDTRLLKKKHHTNKHHISIGSMYVLPAIIEFICMGNVGQNAIHGSCGIASFIRLVCDSFRDSGSLNRSTKNTYIYILYYYKSPESSFRSWFPELISHQQFLGDFFFFGGTPCNI